MPREPKPQQGDEARLFEEYNETLMRNVGRAVSTTPEVVEDACAIAWWRFLTRQPRRDLEWQAWLFVTAKREAWRLDRQRYETLAIDPEEASRGNPRVIHEPADPRDPHLLREELAAAMQVLGRLSPRLRRLEFLRATGMHYPEISDITGDSRTRLSQLVPLAHARVREVLAKERRDDPDLPPRVRRLNELEYSPPPWLLAELGRPPRAAVRRVPTATRLLAWRRAALAVDDYRSMTGFADLDRGLGARPDDAEAARAFDRAQRAIEVLQSSRSIGRTLD